MTFLSHLSKNERYCAILCLAVWSGKPLVAYLGTIVYKIAGEVISEIVISSIYVILVLLCFSYIARTVHKSVYLLYFFLLSIFILSCGFHPDNTLLLEMVFDFPIIVLPYLFIGYVYDVERLFKPMYLLSVASILVQAFYVFFIIPKVATNLDGVEDHMAAAYATLPHVLLIVWYTLKNTKAFNFIMSIMSFIVLFAMGTRGPIIFALLFIALYLLYILFRNTKKTAKLLVITVFSIILINIEAIINYLSIFVERAGGSMRVFDIMDQFEIGEDISSLAKIEIINTLIDSIQSNWLTGLGMGGDRLIIGGYAHNLLIELLVSYGYIGGIAFFIALCLLIYKANNKTSNEYEKSFLLLLVIIGFISLFISNSYLQNPWFFFLIGYSLRLLYKRTSYRLC